MSFCSREKTPERPRVDLDSLHCTRVVSVEMRNGTTSKKKKKKKKIDWRCV